MNKCAFDLGRRCAALENKICERCPFYKSEDKLKDDRVRSAERKRQLPRDVQNQINSKYYKNGEKW